MRYIKKPINYTIPISAEPNRQAQKMHFSQKTTDRYHPSRMIFVKYAKYQKKLFSLFFLELFADRRLSDKFCTIDRIQNPTIPSWNQ